MSEITFWGVILAHFRVHTGNELEKNSKSLRDFEFFLVKGLLAVYYCGILLRQSIAQSMSIGTCLATIVLSGMDPRIRGDDPCA